MWFGYTVAKRVRIRMNVGSWLTTRIRRALVASVILTGVWGVLHLEIATPRGLTRALYPSLALPGQPLSEETTTTIDLDFLAGEIGIPQVFRVRWSGYWFAEYEHRVTLRARADSHVRLYLDGDLALEHEAAGGMPNASTTLTLTAGAHHLFIDYENQGGAPDLSLQSMRGAAPPRPMPTNSLFTRSVDRQDFYETRAVGWLGWVVVTAWLTLPLLAIFPAAGRRLVHVGGPSWRTLPTVIERSTALTVSQTLHIFALTSLAVGQPLFEVVSREPAFFVARNTTANDLVALVGVICIALPTLLVGIEIALARFSTTAASVAHGIVLTIMGGVLLMPLLKRTEVLGAASSIAVALLLAGAAAWAYRRSGGVRTFVTALSPAVFVVPAAFLMNAEVRGAVVATDDLFSPARVANAPPIVLIVFDEFPLNSLLDRNREIDRARYPNVARLVAGASWYRNASTVSSQTIWAVPAIVSGIYPVEANAVPTRRYFPNNLFTMLSESYRMTVFGRFLQLCPANSCTYDLEVHDSLAALLADLGMVYLHIVSPDAMAAQLPPIVGDWRDFATRRLFRDDEGEQRRNDRASEFDRFLETITADREARLYFLHTLTPHMPFEYVPSGRRYEAPDYQRHTEGGSRLFVKSDPWLPTVLQQRHLLQVGFVDRFVGRLVERLKAQGIYDEALIIITSDHGASFQHGMPRRTFTDNTRAEIMMVPLIVKFPGQVSGRVSDENVETVDIVPTIASVLSAAVPYDVDGRSLLDFTQLEKTLKTFVQRDAARSRLEQHERYLDDRYVGLEQKLLNFETGLYALGPQAALVGLPLSTLDSRTGRESFVLLEDLSPFKDVDVESHTLPLFIRGTMSPGIEERVNLAIAVNGIVVATTQSYLEHDTWVFASMIPEEALTPGENDVQVLVVDAVGEKNDY